MKLALVALALAAAVPAAFATPVTYDTLQSQLCVGAAGCGTNTQVLGAVTITFQGTPDSTVDPTGLGGNFTFDSFGSIVITCTAGGTGCGSTPLTGLNLYITIDQSSPLAGSGNIPGGVITGSISGTASSATIVWPNPATATIGDFQYSISDNPLALVPPSNNNGAPGLYQGVTTIQGIVTEAPPGNTDVPEPSTYLLFSAGLLALGLGRKVKRT